MENPRAWCPVADRSSSAGVAGQKGEAMGSGGGEAGVRDEPLARGRPAQGCAEEAGPSRWGSWRRVTDPGQGTEADRMGCCSLGRKKE